MIKKELYDKTVSILEQAYLKNELVHGDCTACAVGNLIEKSFLPRVIEEVKKHGLSPLLAFTATRGDWKRAFVTDNKTGERHQNFAACNGYVKEYIDSTGYTVEELSEIEHAFEIAPKGDSEDEYMFNGLLAIIDMLDKIHENTDEVITQESKAKFVKELA